MAKHLDNNGCVNFEALKEDRIYMEDFIKNYDQVEEERRKFKDYMRYKATELEPLNNDPMIVDMRALLELFRRLPTDPCSVKIRGLRIIFGLVDDKVLFFFSPVALSREVPEPAVPRDVSYRFDKDAQVYSYENGAFREVEKERFDSCRKNYLEKIRIQRHKRSDFYSLLDNGDWDSDTQEVIFSFQEIFYLYHQAYPCPENSAYNENLYFYNGVANYRHSFLNRWRRKHTIFITLEDIDEATHEHDINAISAVNQAANLAHLCPPNCAPVYHITAVYPCP